MVEYIIAGIFLLIFGWSAWRSNGGFDKKESVLLLLGLLLAINFDTISDAKFDTVVWVLVLGAGVLKGIEAYQKIKDANNK